MESLPQPPSHLFIAKMAFGGPKARPGELRLSHEVTGSPRQAGYLTWKSFGGLGKLGASLGELGSRTLNENAE